MLSRIYQIGRRIKIGIETQKTRKRIEHFLKSERIPWSVGYLDFRNQQIGKAILSPPDAFRDWGVGLDERIVELPWLFNRLSFRQGRILDAGSSLNHEFLLTHPKLADKELSICTFFPEGYAKLEQRISYVFADLRQMPFRSQWFDEIACISTLEHIGMDNSMYGYNPTGQVTSEKSFSYLVAVTEMVRILKDGGELYLTFPFGKFEHHGFFQQFDSEMVDKVEALLVEQGKVTTSFYRYTTSGWNESTKDACSTLESHNPHTGVGKGIDGAAHSRAICCLIFVKNLA